MNNFFPINMSRKVALFAVLAFLFGCAFAQSATYSNIKLNVHESSNGHWIAVSPTEDDNITTKVEMLESSSNDWVEMLGNSIWGFWQMWSTSANGFTTPISFRLTGEDGEQVILDNVMTNITGGLVETGVQFASKAAHNNGGHNGNGNSNNNNGEHNNGNGNSHNSNGNNNNNGNGNSHHGSGNNNNGDSASSASSASSDSSSSSSSASSSGSNGGHHTNTQAPTEAPTSAPTRRPSSSGSASGSSTPTTKPTTTPTTKPTTKPSSSSGSASSGNSGSSSGAVKILVPLYVDPGSEWDELITAANAGAPIIAIINPDNGPVSSGPDSSYTSYMSKFADAGIEMVGYVHTLYGDRAVSDVETDVQTYASKYPGLKGIFVDEVSADASELSYYTGLNTNILSKSGYVYNIINPGTVPDSGYANAATTIVVFESPASQWSNSFPSWVSGSPSKFSAIAYAASSSQMSSLVSEMKSAGMGMIYVTDGASGCCTYNDLTSYFSAEASAVMAL